MAACWGDVSARCRNSVDGRLARICRRRTRYVPPGHLWRCSRSDVARKAACSASTTGSSSTVGRMMTQRLDPRSDRPLALQLADLLRAEIQEGHRRPGSQLPTESEFQAAYGVSRTTIRAALATLASEGLVLTRKGFGSFVRSRPGRCTTPLTSPAVCCSPRAATAGKPSAPLLGRLKA